MHPWVRDVCIYMALAACFGPPCQPPGTCKGSQLLPNKLPTCFACKCAHPSLIMCRLPWLAGPDKPHPAYPCNPGPPKQRQRRRLQRRIPQLAVA